MVHLLTGGRYQFANVRQHKEGPYGKCDSLVVMTDQEPKLNKPNSIKQLENAMQTEIEILESRDNPVILWA